MIKAYKKTGYEIIENEIELENNSFSLMKTKLNDLFSMKEFSTVKVTKLKLANPNKLGESNILKILELHSSLVFNNDAGGSRASLVIFEDTYNNETIINHNKKANGLLKRVKQVNSEIKERLTKLSNLPKREVKSLELNNVKPSSFTFALEYVLNDLVDKSDYVFDGSYGNRSNLDANVDFQRGIVWSLEQKRGLIRSLIMDLPIGSFYINRFNIYMEQHNGGDINELSKIDGILYDGKQRLTAILSFLMGEFSVDYNGDEYYVNNIQEGTLKRMLNKSISVYETNFTTKKELLEFYITINTTQTKHSDEDIKKAQELLANL